MSSTSPVAVTSGQAFTDIDALACAVAYAELLRLDGQPAEAVIPGKLNASVTDTIRGWGLPIRGRPRAKDPQVILVDVSDPATIANFADPGNVIEIFDHRQGHEPNWSRLPADKVHIEFLGACATLIWEDYERRAVVHKISQLSARLLYTAIASNTLYFKAQITTDRDRRAFHSLQPFTGLTANWIEQYYEELEKATTADIKTAIVDDTKVVHWPRQGVTVAIGQLERWDGSRVLKDHLEEVKQALASFGHHLVMLTIPSISEGRNYLYVSDPQIRRILISAIQAKFDAEFGVTDRLWLRKEIQKALAELPSM